MTAFVIDTSSRKTATRPNGPTARHTRTTPTGIHASAVIAGGCHVLGVALVIAINPES